MKNYQHASEDEILEHAKTLEGLSFAQIDALNSQTHQRNHRNRGDQGNFIETFAFGIENNNLSDPDFITADIELKVCPLKISKEKLVVKERTKICSINYKELIKENWIESSARKKLKKILFVFYRWNKTSWDTQKIEKIILWHLKPDEALISQEWHSTRAIVKQGRAHLLTESWFKALSPNTSGSGGDADNVEQPIQNIEKYARKRAFSLKRPFVNQFWESIIDPDSFESIQESLNLPAEASIEDKLLELFQPLVGLTIGKISKNIGIEIKDAKNAANYMIKRILGFRSFSSKIKEFEQSGITIKTVPVNKDNNFKPYEHTSFPVVKFQDLIEESGYFNSSLSEQLNRILFIPIHREKRDTSIANATLLEPFFWSPDATEESIIQQEWQMTIDIIKKGIKIETVPWGDKTREQNNLPKSSNTKILHMRPHAKDSSDRDEYALGKSITKQSFWLNKHFMQSLISKRIGHN